MSLFTHYTVSLSSSPLSTKSLTSMAVYIIGDIISQFSTGSNLHTVNRTRILKSGAAGGLGHGPLSHVWYGVSEKFFEMWGWNALSWGGEDHVLAANQRLRLATYGATFLTPLLPLHSLAEDLRRPALLGAFLEQHVHRHARGFIPLSPPQNMERSTTNHCSFSRLWPQALASSSPCDVRSLSYGVEAGLVRGCGSCESDEAETGAF